MTIGAAAGILRCSKMTVFRLVHRGRIKAYRVGRQIRIDRDDLRRFIDEGGNG